MFVAELFRSIQGEGLLTGTESVFVRASGCNLRCWYCDTPYASWQPEGSRMSVDQIAAEVERLGSRHVVVTGGEPMLFEDLVPLTERLRELGHHITIETAGTRYLPVHCDLMSISPKLSNSRPRPPQNPDWTFHHERSRHVPEVVRRLVAGYVYQIKFVVDTPDDCDEVQQYLDHMPEIDRSRVMLMPQGTDVASLRKKSLWLEPYCAAHGLLYCPRRQIEWFGLKRGT